MRLVKWMRAEVLSNLKKKMMQPAREALIKEYQEIVQREADQWYPKEVQDWMAKCPNPSDAFVSRSKMGIKLLQKSTDGGEPSYQRVSHPVLSSSIHSSSTVSLIRPVYCLAIDAYTQYLKLNRPPKGLTKLLKRMDKQLEREREIENTARQALAACSTVKQLEDRFPSLVEYLPDMVAPVKLSVAITEEDVAKVLRKAVRSVADPAKKPQS